MWRLLRVSEDGDRVIVIGSGVIGLCVAYYLRLSGRKVVVVDREPRDGNNCSRENAGMVVPSHFTPLAAPGVVTQGLKWLLDRESPFYVRPRISLDLARWGWLFVRHATEGHVAACAGLMRDLHLESRSLFGQLATEMDFGLVQKGLLMLCESEGFLEEEAELAKRAQDLGLRVEVCDPDRLAELDPDIAMKVRGGIWYEQDCHMDPGQFVEQLYAKLEEGGAEMRYGCAVREVQRGRVLLESGEELHGERVVICGGAWSPELARRVGLQLPMQAGKGYSMTLRGTKELPRLCSLLGEARVAVTPMGEKLRIAGTMEICGNDLSVNERRVRGIIKAACRVFPALRPEDFEGVKRWAGLRPCSPDGLPYIGEVDGMDGVYVAAGHSMLGLSLGPITGFLIEELVNGKKPSFAMEKLNVNRFS